MNVGNITKADAPLDTWTACALKEFDRLGLKTPTTEEVRDAYNLGESPATWAAYVANTDPDWATLADTDPGEFAMALGFDLDERKEGWGWTEVHARDIGEIDITTRTGITFRLIVTVVSDDA